MPPFPAPVRHGFRKASGSVAGAFAAAGAAAPRSSEHRAAAPASGKHTATRWRQRADVAARQVSMASDGIASTACGGFKGTVVTRRGRGRTAGFGGRGHPPSRSDRPYPVCNDPSPDGHGHSERELMTSVAAATSRPSFRPVRGPASAASVPWLVGLRLPIVPIEVLHQVDVGQLWVSPVDPARSRCSFAQLRRSS